MQEAGTRELRTKEPSGCLQKARQEIITPRASRDGIGERPETGGKKPVNVALWLG